MNTYLTGGELLLPTGEKCRRCGKTLKDAESARVGMGPLCRSKNPAGPAQTKDTVDQFLYEPLLAETLVLRRHSSQRQAEIWTNVPHYAVQHSPSGYEWGYNGSGPADLALNLAEAVIMIAKLEGGPRNKCWIGSVSMAAWTIHQDLKRLLLAQAPSHGFEMPFITLLALVRPMVEEFWAQAYSELGAVHV
ncbi:MAG TPA: DUF6011 domain-containing protein [Caldilinea sp.]|nr:DUF6011 domain-containing protein [Caldilinea sp.]